MSNQTLASFVQCVGHLAAKRHLESQITGEWPWPNRPSVENTLQSIKSPLPPVVMAITQPHHDKWLFSGFYFSTTRSFSFTMSSSCPVPQRETFFSSFVVHYAFLASFEMQFFFLLSNIMWPWQSNTTSFTISFSLLLAHILSSRSYIKSRALTSLWEDSL